jgi:uncharacterized damage-inducible protein DinB
MAETLSTTAALARMDEAWSDFHDRVTAIPTERLAARISEDSWTLKQMLAHITAWHDLALDRLVKYASSGEPAELAEHEDVVNARAARAAEGRTIGEVLLAMTDSYRRLRREVGNLADEQLAAHDGWATEMVAVNTYGHYVDHLADLDVAGR